MSTENLEGLLHCSQCEVQGEISFSKLQRNQLNIPNRLLIKNLPEGITQSGIKNLFLSVGTPLSIEFNSRKLTAIVDFKTLNEAELAVRDLNNTPPYFLKVISIANRNENFHKHKHPVRNESESFNVIQLTKETLPEKSSKTLSDIPSEEIIALRKERDIWLENRLKSVNYNPGIRLRQKSLGFKTDTRCISLGRGYYNMGNEDRFVGGLKKCIIDPKNSTVVELPHCEICNSSTSKKCKGCSKAFCSIECLQRSNINHEKCSSSEYVASDNNKTSNVTLSKHYMNLINILLPRKKETESQKNLLKENSPTKLDSEILSTDDESFSFSDTDSDEECLDSEPNMLNSGDTVVITSYVDFKTVYIRSAEKHWEEKYFRLLDDVHYETLKGKVLKDPINVGDVLSAKYYEDLDFYRAQILSIEGDEADLMFIDFGNTQKTKLKDLRYLPKALKEIPGFAIKVELADIPQGSSLEAIRFLNFLTAGEIPLIVKFNDLSEGVILQQKDTNDIVNKNLTQYILPSWKQDESVLSKLGDVIFLDSTDLQKFTTGRSYNITVTHFNEKEFLETGVFWVVDPEADEYLYLHTELKDRVNEYCDLLKDDGYLPRLNEVCLAQEKGEWHRCVTVDTKGTSCFLFFADKGHSAPVETIYIRKIVEDFIEVPFQAVCCVLSDKLDLKSNAPLRSQVLNYFKNLGGRQLKSVFFNKSMGDAYCVSVPEIDEMFLNS